MRINSTYLRSACGFLLAALAFELLLRHLSWTSPISPGEKESTLVSRLLEGWGISHWDSRGVRRTPPGGGPVVLAVGDSFTESAHVDDDHVYTARLQALLGSKVLNVGRTSLSPADYLLSAARLQSQFQPAWTIIQLDASDLSDDGFVAGKTHFERREGRLIAVTPPAVHLGRTSRILARLRPHSALLNNGIARGGMFRALAQTPPLFRAAEDGEGSATAVAETAPPVEEELSMMAAAYRERVTFFFIPAFGAGEDGVEVRFLAYCAFAKLSCVDLRAAFADFAHRGRAPFGFSNSRFGQGHMNAEGHDAAAILLARELSSLRRRGLF